MEGPPLGPGGGDITWPDKVAPGGRKASSTRKIKPQTSPLLGLSFGCPSGGCILRLAAARVSTCPPALGTLGGCVVSGSASSYSVFCSGHAGRLRGFWQRKLTRRSVFRLLGPTLPDAEAQALVVSTWLLRLQGLTHSSYKVFTVAIES